jgi:hypothetical protein
MAKNSQAGAVKIIILVLVLLGLAGGGIYYFLQSKTPDYSITFHESKQVPVGAKVYMAGVEIGKIVSIKPYGTGVAVGIKVRNDYQDNLTEASRFFLDPERTGGSLLVKNIRAQAPPLKPGQVVEGTDSSFQWSAYDFARGMNELFESGQIRQGQEAVHSYLEEMERQLDRMDWNKLGQDMERQMEEFSREMEKALNEEDLKNLRRDIEKNYREALGAIDRVQNSEEARKLREAIDDFYGKFREELTREEASERGTGQRPPGK